MAIVGVVLVVIGCVLLFMRRSQQAKLSEMMATETTTAEKLLQTVKYVTERMGQAGSFKQVAEVKGTIQCDSPLTSEIAKEPCVYYSSSVSREYEETYWETDSQTKEREQKTRRGSDTVSNNEQRVRFWVEDSTGRTQIDPSGADVDAVKVVDRFEQGEQQEGGQISFGAFSFSIGAFGGNSGTRTLGYKFTESIIPLGRPIYVLGEASDSSGALLIQKSAEKGAKFIISLKTEEELVRSAGSAVQWLLVGGIGLNAVGAVMIVMGLIR